MGSSSSERLQWMSKNATKINYLNGNPKVPWRNRLLAEMKRNSGQSSVIKGGPEEKRRSSSPRRTFWGHGSEVRLLGDQQYLNSSIQFKPSKYDHNLLDNQDQQPKRQLLEISVLNHIRLTQANADMPKTSTGLSSQQKAPNSFLVFFLVDGWV